MARRRPPGLLKQVLIGLVVAGSQGGWAQPTPSPEAFGRWEQPLRQCRIQRWPPPGDRTTPVADEPCQSLRLDQQIEGLLVVRWLATPARGLRRGRQISFAGMLDRGSAPMRCTPEGRCRPTGAMAVWLSALATSGFGPAQPSAWLPSSRLVQGLCRLEARRVVCEATERDGSRWRSEGQR
ncbi:MAG: hypothetical protein VKO65_07270 [Cyanobacteriota bacterium]|nr:hypothetical protein [Cyanobacteriota bacterium]